jgi:hypothetical protein
MPARSKKQQRLFAMALAAKRGKTIHSDKVNSMAESMSEKTLHDFAATARKHLPEKKAAHPLVESTLGRLFGSNYIPSPRNGEDMYDAFLRRNRDISLANIQSEQFANNPLFQRLGINKHPITKAIGYFGGSSAGQPLSNIIGGNPSAAAEHIHNAMNSPQFMQSFGRVGTGTAGEANNIVNALKHSFYKKAEQLIGGEGDNQPDSRYPKKELRKGVAHEQEHTKSKSIAKEIAKDHLEERKDYYTALAKAKIGNY